MSTLIYNSVENCVELSFEFDGLRVTHNEKLIAIFEIKLVWDAAKNWLSNITTTTDDVGLRRRKVEACIARDSAIVISRAIMDTH